MLKYRDKKKQRCVLLCIRMLYELSELYNKSVPSFKMYVKISDYKLCSSSVIFYQIYTILRIFNGKSLPLCYLLMKKKSKCPYEEAFNFLKNRLKIKYKNDYYKL